MKIRLFAKLLLALLLVSQWGGVALADSDSSNVKSSQQPGPSIQFLRPVRNERFYDFPIFVQVEVSGFQLMPPDEHHSSSAPANTGHIAYSLDDYPICMTDDTQVMIGKKLGNSYLPAGLHVLKVQLVDANDNALNPPVVASTEVLSGHPALVQVINKTTSFGPAELTAAELYKIWVHLEELQKELRKIETGNSGYAPMPIKGTGQSTE